MDKRQQEIDAINKMIKEQRSRIAPDVLAFAERVAKQSQNIPTDAKDVPYDRASANKAVEIFLKSHDDPKGFQKKLFELLKKKDN